MQDNVLTRRRTLGLLIDDGCIDERVLIELLPGGVPIPDEDLLWDYKQSLPVMPASPSKLDKDEYAAKMAEVAKDAVAFHNMYGGYLIIGVNDGDRSVCGFVGAFDANDLVKKIQGATRETVDVKFRLVASAGTTIGLLYVPRRSNRRDPVQFLKDAPASTHGRKAYQANDIFMRSGENCRAATTSADIALLFNRDRLGPASVAEDASFIQNNLPAKDPNLIEFVGREEQLDDLWRWFVDRYTAVKLLSGSGGVGKTSIAWTFCDAVTRTAPVGLEKVVWLTAKKRTYAAMLGKHVDIAHTHFADLPSLLLAILGELGVPEEQIPDDPSREDLIEECIAAVKSWPCLLVVDDIDSLPNEEQYDVFRTISTIFDRVIATGMTRARALLTARLNIGAAPGQLMSVKGLPIDDFTDFVTTAASSVNAPLPVGGAQITAIKRLHEASNGSPLFASAILRLVAMGEPLGKAINQYKGADGEEVRRFAFEKELGSLTDSQLRLVFAAVHLRDCTIDELVEATHSNRALVRDDVAALRNYHLMSLGSPASGYSGDEPIVSVPSEIAAMADIIRKRIVDPKRIETNCARINRKSETSGRQESRAFQRVVQCWADDDFTRAVETAEQASRDFSKNADVWCLLGRAYLKLEKPDAGKADAALRKADELKSVRPELLSLRLEAKQRLGDEVGVVQLLEQKGVGKLDAKETLTLAHTFQSLGEAQAQGGHGVDAEAYFLRGARAIRDAFDDNRARGLVEPLMALKSDLMVAWATLIARRVGRDEDKIEVWDAAVETWRSKVFHRGVLTLGINAAGAWWAAAARREKAEPATLARVARVVRDLWALSDQLEQRGPGWLQVSELARRTAQQLSQTSAIYGRRLRN